MVEGGSKCIKYLVFVFNFLFFLTGCGLIGIGIWLNVERDDWKGISDYNYISVANVIIAAGVIIVIVAFLGCCGAITENKHMLLGFFTLLLLIFMMEMGAGVAAYIWRGEVEDELLKQVTERIPGRYYKEDGVMKAMNAIQKEFKCCGVHSISDWRIVAKDNSGASMSKIDASCCIMDSKVAGYNSNCVTKTYLDYLNSNVLQAQYYSKGCFDSIKKFLEDNLLYVGICGIVFAVFQIIGMICAMVLYCAIRKEGQTV